MSYYQWVEGVDVTLNNHEVYHSKEEVMEAIRENKEEIARLKMELFGLCCGNPKDLLLNDEEANPIDLLQAKFDNIFNGYECGIEYLVAHNVDLYYIYENWDKVKEG